MPRSGLEVLSPPDFDDFGCFVLLAAEVLEVRGAEAAANLLDVEGDVGHVLVVERGQEEAAEVFAAGATEPRTPPDFANAVDPGIPPAINRGEPRQQFGPSAQLVLDGGHLFGRERLFEVSFEFGLSDAAGHILASGMRKLPGN